MPLDGILLRFLKNEIEQAAVGCRVDKVHQPSKDELVLLLRSRNGTKRLLLSASANSPRIHFTETAAENPKAPPMFCMLLRKHLTGAVLSGVRQEGTDRILFLDFDCRNEIGDKTKFSLCVEIMAKHSNIMLLDENNTIVEAVKRIDFTKSEIRQILPSMPYTPPPAQEKVSIFEVTSGSLINKVIAHKDELVSTALLAVIQGFSPLICREIADASCGDGVKVNNLSEMKINRLAESLEFLKRSVENEGGKPVMLINGNGKPVDFSFMDITQYGALYDTKTFESFSGLLDEFYCERDRIDRMRQRSADTVKSLSNATARAARKLSMQQEELANCANRETLRIYAELISANQFKLQKGAAFCDLENYYENNKVIRIPLDQALSPQANSQKYYKEYRKAKTAEQKLTELVEKGGQELQYLESVSDSLSRAGTQAELDEIREELTAGGYLKQRNRPVKKAEKPLPPLEFQSSDGFRILVGRNNLQNDRLSLRVAVKNDLWLHTQKIPGAHVVIIAENKVIPPSTVEQAAVIAAYHSKASESSLVPVDYTLAKNLKKPPGAKPGKVIYNSFNTIWVKPVKTDL